MERNWFAARDRLRHGFESSARFCSWAMDGMPSCTWSRFSQPIGGWAYSRIFHATLPGLFDTGGYNGAKPPVGYGHKQIQNRMIPTLISSTKVHHGPIAFTLGPWDPWIRNYPSWFKNLKRSPCPLLDPLPNATHLVLQNASSHTLLINAPPKKQLFLCFFFPCLYTYKSGRHVWTVNEVIFMCFWSWESCTSWVRIFRRSSEMEKPGEKWQQLTFAS